MQLYMQILFLAVSNIRQNLSSPLRCEEISLPSFQFSDSTSTSHQIDYYCLVKVMCIHCFSCSHDKALEGSHLREEGLKFVYGLRMDAVHPGWIEASRSHCICRQETELWTQKSLWAFLLVLPSYQPGTPDHQMEQPTFDRDSAFLS